MNLDKVKGYWVIGYCVNVGFHKYSIIAGLVLRSHSEGFLMHLPKPLQIRTAFFDCVLRSLSEGGLLIGTCKGKWKNISF